MRVKYGGQTLTQPFEVRAQPDARRAAEDLKKQFDLLRHVRDGLSATTTASSRSAT